MSWLWWTIGVIWIVLVAVVLLFLWAAGELAEQSDLTEDEYLAQIARLAAEKRYQKEGE